MGLNKHGNSESMFDEMQHMDFFGEFGDPFSPELLNVCDLNKTETFEPVQNQSSDEFKIVNDAVKKFQEAYQPMFRGNVLVLGSGQVTLQRNFVFDDVSCVWYVEPNRDSCAELVKRLKDVTYVHRVFQHTFSQFLKRSVSEGWRFDVIITNHSIHHICEGKHPTEQLDVCVDISSLMTPEGVWIGAGPSLGGMTNTPGTLEVRSNAGLYGFERDSGGRFYSTARFAETKYRECVFFSAILHAIPGGKAAIIHLSQFGAVTNDLLRMYEGFVFLKGASYPDGVQLDVQIDNEALENLDLVHGVRLALTGRVPSPVPVVDVASTTKALIDHTKGQLLLACHMPHLFYSGPFLVSEKLDGELVYLQCSAGKLTLFYRDCGYIVKQEKRCKDFLLAGELIDGQFWWLETIYYDGRSVNSWILGLGNFFPSWVGFKDYHSLRSDFARVGEGIVIHDPNTPCGSGKVRQYFVKWKTTIDTLDDDDRVVEKDLFGVVKDRSDEGHSPNGSLRALEGPFVLHADVLSTWLAMREAKRDLKKGGGESFSFDDILLYPQLNDGLGILKARNTIVQQFWRGYVQLDDGALQFVSSYSPFGRMEDAMQLYGALLSAIVCGRFPDKDGIIAQYKNDSDLKLALEDEDEAPLQMMDDDDNDEEWSELDYLKKKKL
jgi:hypothetical protein